MNRITNIEIQKNNKNRVNIYIDEEFSFACDAELVYRQGLKKNLEVDILKVKEVVDEDEVIKCKNSALRTLEKAYKTEKEIRDKLKLKGYSDKVISKTFDILKEYNFINDNKFADMYIKDRAKTQGRNKIKYALIKKGIKDDVISEKLNALDIHYEKDVAFKLAKKKYDILCKREKDTFKLSQKLFRFLMGKGYSYECTNEIVKKIINIENFME